MKINGDISLGRAFDNSICLQGEDVSSYHALVEQRGDGYWLSDLGSASGTAVNGARVAGVHQLGDGDVIAIGRAHEIRFHADGVQLPRPARQTPRTGSRPRALAGTKTTPQAAAGSHNDRLSWAQIALAGAPILGLLLIVVGGLAWKYWLDRGKCGNVKIVSPKDGATISAPANIIVSNAKADCVKRVSYQIDGIEIASKFPPAFDATLDPADLRIRFPQITEGEHQLSVQVEDQRGKSVQTSTLRVRLVMPPISDGPTWTEVRGWALGLAARISEKSESNFVIEQEFAEEILKHTRAFRFDFLTEARNRRLEINKAFLDKGLSPLLGYVAALSQSGFKPENRSWACQSDSNGVGLWRIPRADAFNLRPPGTPDEMLGSPQVAAAYLKNLLNPFSKEDFMYAITCYGGKQGAEGELSISLAQLEPEIRRNFWKFYKQTGMATDEMARQVICFLAAGVVGEYPRRFGLNAEPLSSLY